MLSDCIHIDVPPSKESEDESEPVLIYYIPGNPGLIEYYRGFFSDLKDSLETSSQHGRYILHGQSLAGFETVKQDIPHRSQSPPYDLQQQVEDVGRRLEDVVASVRKEHSDPDSTRPTRVILAGHSVGAYILLERIRLQQQEQKQNGLETSSYELVGGICLFPTVVDIAKSPRGRQAALFSRLPNFALPIHLLARFLCFIVSTKFLLGLVRLITRMPDQAAEVTAAFLNSSHGVRQALHMGRYEMLEITDDKWSDSVWNSKETSETSDTSIEPSLFFYWGETDCWVDNKTRDTLIATRADGKDEGKPHMEIDTQGIPHAFCIRHNKPVADKVAAYVEQIVQIHSD